MISEQTIQAIRDISVEEIVSRYLEVKKHAACCPFHNENTPSLRINNAKNIFKCFGCGVAGDGIKFVELHEKLTFSETLERIARDHGIHVEYIDTYTPEERKAHTDKMDTYRQILNYAQNFYTKALANNDEIKSKLYERGITDDDIIDWKLGYAPDGFQGIVKGIVERGWFEPAFHIGLVGTTSGTNWDMYRNRITIPLSDRHGQIIGFSARVVDDSKPKYLNPKESDIYQKSNMWFGWDEAIKSIAEEKNARIVEGYFDVISLHRKNVTNAIAGCGTEIDEKQLRLLKPHTSCITLMYDGDNAGQKKIAMHTKKALKLGFAVQVVEMPEGKDPDDLSKQFNE